MNHVVIAMGSNIDPGRNLRLAVRRLEEEHRLVSMSTIVETEPIGEKNQPNFLNGAVLIETDLDKQALAAWIRRLEVEMGRVRTEQKYGPRPIDLDIVVWNGRIVHEDVRRRDFVRRAVSEVLPDLAL